MRALVLGLGNLLMSDDGLGCHAIGVIKRRYLVPAEVKLVDGGTLGLDLLPLFEGVDLLVLIDALNMDAAAGEVFRLAGAEVPRAFANKLSVHQVGVQDLLIVAELQGHLPSELVVWGAQPLSLEMGTALTAELESALGAVVAGVARDLAGRGVDLREKIETGSTDRLKHNNYAAARPPVS
ncbi:MAG: hydrogenase expression/formation protein [Desulfuromonas sp.]|nr:MAG: hydrogenase expression/formation protein [Desulfuromonas sp.]